MVTAHQTHEDCEKVNIADNICFKSAKNAVSRS